MGEAACQEDEKTCEHVTDPAAERKPDAAPSCSGEHPRSGNTWTRELLGSLYELEQIPVHTPEEVDWEHLPERCVIQIHWYPKEPFLQLLERHDVQVAVLARHPFDVLMSWLNCVLLYSPRGVLPRWRRVPRLCAIVGVLPRSEAFLEWTRSEYARCFLFHSPSWWDRPEIIRVRYEDLVADTQEALERLVQAIGQPPRRSIATVVEANAIGRKKPGHEVWHFHYWQGQPGTLERTDSGGRGPRDRPFDPRAVRVPRLCVRPRRDAPIARSRPQLEQPPVRFDP